MLTGLAGSRNICRSPSKPLTSVEPLTSFMMPPGRWPLAITAHRCGTHPIILNGSRGEALRVPPARAEHRPQSLDHERPVRPPRGHLPPPSWLRDSSTGGRASGCHLERGRGVRLLRPRGPLDERPLIAGLGGGGAPSPRRLAQESFSVARCLRYFPVSRNSPGGGAVSDYKPIWWRPWLDSWGQVPSGITSNRGSPQTSSSQLAAIDVARSSHDVQGYSFLLDTASRPAEPPPH
jgi:hypothetical protein